MVQSTRASIESIVVVFMCGYVTQTDTKCEIKTIYPRLGVDVSPLDGSCETGGKRPNGASELLAQ